VPSLPTTNLIKDDLAKNRSKLLYEDLLATTDELGGSFVGMEGTLPNRGDAPAALLMAALFFSFGLFAILRPDKLRSMMDNFANAWKQGAWHPYRMPLPVLRLVVGGTGIGGAALFVLHRVALGR
jgi:hypothetical protein